MQGPQMPGAGGEGLSGNQPPDTNVPSGPERTVDTSPTLGCEHNTALKVPSMDGELLLENLVRDDLTADKLTGCLEEFCSGEPDPENRLSEDQRHAVRCRLAKMLLTDDEGVLEVAEKVLTVQDYLEISKSIITTEDGLGKIGGKAAGKIVGYKLLCKARDKDPAPDFLPVVLTDSRYLTSDNFERVLAYNGLTGLGTFKYSSLETTVAEYEDIKDKFRNIRFPPELEAKVRAFIESARQTPLKVRSSSLLEDATGAPFAGKYVSIDVPNQGTADESFEALRRAIGDVYASTFSPDAIEYRKKLGLREEDEQMGVIIETMVGVEHGKLFFPPIAGVGMTYNDDPWKDHHKPEDGFLRLSMGLGESSVDINARDIPRLASLTRPTEWLQPDFIQRVDTAQKHVLAVNLETGETVKVHIADLVSRPGSEGVLPERYSKDIAPNDIVSYANMDGERIYPGTGWKGDSNPRLITFDGLLGNEKFIQKMRWLVETLRGGFEREVDFEFASDGKRLFFLQARHELTYAKSGPVNLPDIPAENVIFSAETSKTARLENVDYIVYVDPQRYAQLIGSNMKDYKKVVDAVRSVNQALHEEGKSFILVGPGRWGTDASEPALGVPAAFKEIDHTSLLCEVIDPGAGNFHEPSMGSHWASDLRRLDIKVIAIYPNKEGQVLNCELLGGCENSLGSIASESLDMRDVVRVIDVAAAADGKRLQIAMDGRSKKALAWLA